ncbi:winged helix-turn-helix domain-containing protein [Zavarzinia compransoris]|uniref:LysR family transcriptional regulator n=1 Tax=Zavarzinia compransoris TaxID=1264899 RepID=A0A317E926_9PROT|nr:LysR family transcriptional regulator [Zavarzinia compransoris]PWR23082.1 LysR family transcriptional regulator [Zavarzinia compransoris]TDP46370.1 molybdate transport system regulatory protein [Zavarzinia compransoris]
MPHFKIRLYFDDDSWLGPGKIELLERIAAAGSIAAASREMNMSYKRAWDLVAEMNRIFGQPVVSAQMGGRHGGGAELTPLGRCLIARFRAIEATCNATAAAEIDAIEALRQPAAS